MDKLQRTKCCGDDKFVSALIASWRVFSALVMAAERTLVRCGVLVPKIRAVIASSQVVVCPGTVRGYGGDK